MSKDIVLTKAALKSNLKKASWARFTYLSMIQNMHGSSAALQARFVEAPLSRFLAQTVEAPMLGFPRC